MLHEIVPGILKDTHEKLNSTHFSKATSTSIEDSELLPLSVSIDRENQTITTGTVIGKSMYLYALKYLLKNTAQVMDNYPWQIIHAAEGISFPTSDDPVCFYYTRIHLSVFRKRINRILKTCRQTLAFLIN